MGVRQLNQRAAQLAAQAAAHAELLRIGVHEGEAAQVLDFGVAHDGGLGAGLLLARICMSGLADISLAPADPGIPEVPQVTVRTDHPVEACLMSQYAGWKIATDDYFAMGSGPMRALARVEDLFEELPTEEDGLAAVGVLESGRLPTSGALERIRDRLQPATRLTIAVAPTASLAGSLQVVARSVETALHKLHALEFPLSSILSGAGRAPLPPVAGDDLVAIGRTNDAILYGGVVNLWVRTDDETIRTAGPHSVSSASASHGQTFLSLFEAANRDFYALDTALFSPAMVVFHNLQTGNSFSFGELFPELVRSSFGC